MPEITADTPTRKIQIQSLPFTSFEPYSEGHPCSANEAQALNQTYNENLRNNFANKVREAIEAAGSADAVDMDKLQATFEGYAMNYEFNVRGSGGFTGDPVKTQAMDLARTAVREALKKKGHKLKDIDSKKITELAANAVETNPKFMAAAEKLVAEREAAGADLEVSIEG